MEIKKELFGELESTKVFEYTLANNNGYSLSVTTYGAIITKLMMPDKEGTIENDSKRVEIEVAQMYDGNPNNNEVKY